MLCTQNSLFNIILTLFRIVLLLLLELLNVEA